MSIIKDSLLNKYLLAKAFMENIYTNTNDFRMSKKYGLQNLLNLYAYVQIIEIGENITKEPPKIDKKRHLQWKAWYNLSYLSKEESMQRYVDFVCNKL